MTAGCSEKDTTEDKTNRTKVNISSLYSKDSRVYIVKLL